MVRMLRMDDDGIVIEHKGERIQIALHKTEHRRAWLRIHADTSWAYSYVRNEKTTNDAGE